MTRFEDDLKKQKNPWIKRIGKYLLTRNDLKETLNKENKSLRECFDYILIELSKDCEKEGKIGYVADDDEVLYSLAVHYYDEDDIQVGEKNFSTNADGSADVKKLQPKRVNNYIMQKTIDEAVHNAIEEYKREEKQKKEEEKKKIEENKAKKISAKQNKDQMNLFDMLGEF